MASKYPNPSAFHNIDKRLHSPDGFHKIVYYDLNEIAMCAPLGGICFLETKDKQKIKIHEWVGGPPIWEEQGFAFAIPIWTKDSLKGTVQKIGIVDTRIKDLKIYSRIFNVLDFISFEKNIITGINSPFYMPTSIEFDIDKEEIELILQLVK